MVAVFVVEPRLNAENPDRGIETAVAQLRLAGQAGLNAENPDRGIETLIAPGLLYLAWEFERRESRPRD